MNALATVPDAMHDVFREAVCADPADDTARLVYADWLEEQGIAHPNRAELIRVQVELAGMAEFDADWENGRCTVCGEEESPSSHYHCLECGVECGMMGCGKEDCAARGTHRAALEGREEELLRWADEFLLPLWMSGRAGFRKGFVETVRVSWEEWETSHAFLKAQYPLREVHLETLPDYERVHDTCQGSWYTLAPCRPLGIHVYRGDEEEVFVGDVVLRLLRAEWPEITFYLPEE